MIGIGQQILVGHSTILCADSILKVQCPGYQAEKPDSEYMIWDSRQPMIGIGPQILGGPSVIPCADSSIPGQCPGYRADLLDAEYMMPGLHQPMIESERLHHWQYLRLQ